MPVPRAASLIFAAAISKWERRSLLGVEVLENDCYIVYGDCLGSINIIQWRPFIVIPIGRLERPIVKSESPQKTEPRRPGSIHLLLDTVQTFVSRHQ
jgi:hypothetical protein